MAVTTLFAFLLGLLHLWVGICGADDLGGEFFNEKAFIYDNPYLAINSTDNKVIVDLASKGKCMSYIGTADLDPTGADPKELAACELYCAKYPFDTWSCVAPTIDQNNLDWSTIFTNEDLYQWSVGTCMCWNSSDPTPSAQDGSPDTPGNELAAADATKQVKDLTAFSYVLREDDIGQGGEGWRFWKIRWADATMYSSLGTFGVPKDPNLSNTLRVHEIWAASDRRDPSQKAFMHDDVVGFWRLTPLFRNLNDLKEIKFDTIIESELTMKLQPVYQLMGEADLNNPLTVTRSGTRNGEQQAFQLLLRGTKFGRRMQQAIDEFEEMKHRSIEAFYFTGLSAGFDFGIYLDGYDPARVGHPDIWSWNQALARLMVRQPMAIAKL
ncbi:hypothetical protein Daus18300_003878 [Diaporthe australafricana]|uniref:Uncharacterized protein n=1 Tax=Diaporthe australafricana TaxID=127596 RepID=A0ABR3XCJ8_9PEZI